MLTGLPTDPVRLDRFRLDWGRLRLHDGPVSTKLTPKAAAILAILLARPATTVARAELFDAVWPGSFSSDEVLTQVIQELRRAFGDRERVDKWIETVPKLGYRWQGPVPVRDEAPGVPELPLPALAQLPPEPVVVSTARRSWMWTAAVATIAIVLVAFVQFSGDVPASATPPIARPLLRQPASELDPALEFNGRRLAYVSHADGRYEVRLRDLAAGTETIVVESADQVLASPRLSRAGTELAYLRRDARRCVIHVLELASGADRPVARDCPQTLPSSLDWSADGRSLFYSRPAIGMAQAQISLAIHQLDLAGGPPRRVSDSGRWISTDIHPRVSADGLSLAWVRDGEGHNRVVIRALGNSAEREIELRVWPYRVEWLGSDLALAVHGTSGLEIWRASSAGKLGELLAREGAGPGLSVGPDRRLVFERHRADDNLWRLELAVAAARPVQVTNATGSELAPRIAADGKRLAYLADATGDLEVHLLDLETGQSRQWSRLAPRVPLDLRWAPDGQRLALIIGTEEGKRVGILEVDGSLLEVPKALAELAPAQLEWSADGDLWVAAEQQGRRQLLRAHGPAFSRVEPAVDRSIGAFAFDGARPILVLPDGNQFEDIDGRPIAELVATARPWDQWAWKDGQLAQAIQLGGGEARLTVHTIADGRLVREFSAVLPEPPLGRHLDLGAGSLWYTRRDRVETDLYELSVGE